MLKPKNFELIGKIENQNTFLIKYNNIAYIVNGEYDYQISTAYTVTECTINDFLAVYFIKNNTLELKHSQLPTAIVLKFEEDGLTDLEADVKENDTTKNDLEDGTIINDKGAKESNLKMRYDLLPAKAITEISKVLKTGAEKYGVDNWRNLTIETNINHALYHLFMYLENGEIGDLKNAGCRVLFALELKKENE